MKDIVNALLKRIREKKPSMIVTVVSDKGSAPRSAGANMVVGEEGRITGTIGGGMLEYRATQMAVEDIAKACGELREFRLTKDEVAGLGMVCGGDVDILFTYIAPDEKNAEVFERLSDNLAAHRAAWILLPLDGSGAGFFGSNELCGVKLSVGNSEIAAVELGIIGDENERCYIQKIANASRVYVFGGGHLAQELVPLLSHLGFRCVVTDDRAEFSTKELFPDAEELHTIDFNSLDGKFDIQPQDFIVTVTRGHMGDFEVQEFALGTPAYYIGVVGSRSKIKTVNAKLKADGFTDDDIKRITAPIGLDIKSETPAEIAVSIAAQLIERRASYKA